MEKNVILRISFAGECNFQDNTYLKRAVEEYWKGNRGMLKYKLPAPYAKFETVFKKVQEIPFGKVSSYGSIAKAVFGNKKYARLIGTAMKNNPLLIIIPCHRVIRSNGNIGGFSGGVDIKIKLLKLEGVELKNGYIKKEYFTNF